MPGGGGLIGVNYVGEVAKNDGLTLIMWTWNPMAWLVEDPGLRVEMGKFRSVGGLGFRRGHLHAHGHGERHGTERYPEREAVVRRPLAHRTSRTSSVACELDILGANSGLYCRSQGVQQSRARLRQGRNQFHHHLAGQLRLAVKRNFVDKGMATPVYQAGVPTAHGTVRHRDFPDLPTYDDETYKAVHGGRASGEKWQLYSFLLPMRAGMADVVSARPARPTPLSRSTVRRSTRWSKASNSSATTTNLFIRTRYQFKV